METTEAEHPPQVFTPQARYGNLGFVTVDNESTRDIDDGMWMEKNGDDVHIVIAIADPTRLVAIGSTEDESARLMGSTMYVRDRAVRKMLPPRISEEEGSLVAGRRRKAFIMDITLDKDLEIRAFELQRCMIKVAHRLSYEDIPVILQKEDDELRPMVGLAAQVGRMLLQKRRQAGALALYDLTRLLLTDEDGRLVQLTRADEMVGHIIVQELMVLTNTLMAGYMLTHNIPGIFRNHEPSSAAPPTDELARTIESWMRSTALDAEKVQAQFALIVGKAQYSTALSPKGTSHSQLGVTATLLRRCGAMPTSSTCARYVPSSRACRRLMTRPSWINWLRTSTKPWKGASRSAPRALRMSLKGQHPRRSNSNGFPIWQTTSCQRPSS